MFCFEITIIRIITKYKKIFLLFEAGPPSCGVQVHRPLDHQTVGELRLKNLSVVLGIELVGKVHPVLLELSEKEEFQTHFNQMATKSREPAESKKTCVLESAAG